MTTLDDAGLRQDDPAWEPPLRSTEAAHLLGALDRLRATFRWKADGLDRDGLARRLPTSTLSLGALLKHLAVCEDDVFAWKILGERPEAWMAIPEMDDPHRWMFTVGEEETAEDLYAFYDAAVARSRERQALLDRAGALDEPAALSAELDQSVSVRRMVVDLIEEYGRHTGHADLLREAVDGRVGEDPDPSWTPGWYGRA